MNRDSEYALERKNMVDEQLRGRGISDRRVLEAMAYVPRHEFVRPEDARLAYADMPLGIGQHQTISQPYIVALMTEWLGPRSEEVVLEVGTGSGYQAAVLSRLCRQVYSLERIPELAERARIILRRLGLKNVEVITGDGSLGWPPQAPFPAIMVTAAAPHVPKSLLAQLADGGRLVLPVGGRDGQILESWVRRGSEMDHERIAPVAFVPLVGDQGWAAEESASFTWL
jgi:protein-L-isoaspartate(D-aspartate) O-methyltransferase